MQKEEKINVGIAYFETKYQATRTIETLNKSKQNVASKTIQDQGLKWT